MGLGLRAGGTLSIETEEATGHHLVQGFPGQAKGLRLSPLGHESHRRDGQDPSDTRSLSRSTPSKPSPRAHTPQAQLPMLDCRHSKRAKRFTWGFRVHYVDNREDSISHWTDHFLSTWQVPGPALGGESHRHCLMELTSDGRTKRISTHFCVLHFRHGVDWATYPSLGGEPL